MKMKNKKISNKNNYNNDFKNKQIKNFVKNVKQQNGLI